MPKKCEPRKYMKVHKGDVIYCFKCTPHRVLGRQYATEEARDRALANHQEDPEK